MSRPDFDEAEQQRVTDKITAARRLLGSQEEARNIEAQICDLVRAERQKVPGLEQAIRRLSIEQPAVFQYLQRLEFLNQGIWCPKCSAQKTVGPKQVQIDQLSAAVAELENLRRVFDKKVEAQRKKIDEILAQVREKKLSADDLLGS